MDLLDTIGAQGSNYRRSLGDFANGGVEARPWILAGPGQPGAAVTDRLRAAESCWRILAVAAVGIRMEAGVYSSAEPALEEELTAVEPHKGRFEGDA